MPKEVIMPALGMAQESGVLIAWLVPEGAEVREGEPLMEVETDKAVVEVPAAASGTLTAVAYQAGAEVPIGTVLAVILEAGQADDHHSGSQSMQASGSVTGKADSAVTEVAPPPPNAVHTSAGHPGAPPVPPEYADKLGRDAVVSALSPGLPPGRILSSPKAKRLAREHGISLASVRGTGPQGAVRAVDLVTPSPARETGPVAGSASRTQQEAPPSSTAVSEGEALRSLPRPVRAARMGWCRATFDPDPLLRFLETMNASSKYSKLGLPWPEELRAGDFLTRALIGALRHRAVPELGRLMSGGVVSSIYSPDGTRFAAKLEPHEVQSVLDAAMARQGAEGRPSGADLGALIHVEDRTAQSFEQSGGPLPHGVAIRLTLGPLNEARKQQPASQCAYLPTNLRLEYDADDLDDAAVAVVFSHLIRVLEDPFSLAVYG